MVKSGKEEAPSSVDREGLPTNPRCKWQNNCVTLYTLNYLSLLFVVCNRKFFLDNKRGYIFKVKCTVTFLKTSIKLFSKES